MKYISDNIITLAEDKGAVVPVIPFVIREEMLNEEGARCLLDHCGRKDDTETKAPLLQYIHDRFGTDDSGDYSF